MRSNEGQFKETSALRLIHRLALYQIITCKNLAELSAHCSIQTDYDFNHPESCVSLDMRMW